MSISSRTLYPVLALCALTLPLTLSAQEVERDVSVQSQETARLDGFSYQEGPESHLAFHGTPIALAASGEAEVEFQDGRARVDVDVKKLPKVSSLGPFATYVLWAVTADGNANNLGSIEVKDGNGSLEATTPLARCATFSSPRACPIRASTWMASAPITRSQATTRRKGARATGASRSS